MDSNLVGALKTGGHHFGDGVHAVLGLLDDGVDFGESGRFAHRRVLDGELQLLDVRRDLVDMIQQLLLQTPCRNLRRRRLFWLLFVCLFVLFFFYGRSYYVTITISYNNIKQLIMVTQPT